MYKRQISYRLIGALFAVFVVAAVGLAITSSYRFTRLLVFLDPWSDPFGDGYQAVSYTHLDVYKRQHLKRS